MIHTPIPQHIAIIMDGNGRWATQRGRPRGFGHRAGREALRRAVRRCAELKVPNLTVFAFSSENWSRPPSEVRVLMDLLHRALKQEIKELHENNIQVRFIGELSAFSTEIRALIARAEKLTANNARLHLNIAINYGGQWDIAQAAAKAAQAAADGRLKPADIDENLIGGYLNLADIPPPDLLIRTGGEMRLSNFILWQLAYTELYFSDVLWPDFDADHIDQAIKAFGKRERRYGHTSDQVAEVRSA